MEKVDLGVTAQNDKEIQMIKDMGNVSANRPIIRINIANFPLIPVLPVFNVIRFSVESNLYIVMNND